jgi:hypothetical protein
MNQIKIINLTPIIYTPEKRELDNFSLLVANKEIDIGRYLTDEEIDELSRQRNIKKNIEGLK